MADLHFRGTVAELLKRRFHRVITQYFADPERIPTDLEAVKLLVSSPAVSDLFMWLSYRSFTAKGEERIPLFGPEGLTAQLGSVEYARSRKFRERLEDWLDSIRQIWPECGASIASDGRALVIRSAAAIVTGESRAAS